MISMLQASEQASEKRTKPPVPTINTRRMENTDTSQPVSGIMTISATR